MACLVYGARERTDFGRFSNAIGRGHQAGYNRAR